MVKVVKLPFSVKHNVRDSVFTKMLSTKKRSLEFYKAICPDDVKATEDDLEIITLRPVFTSSRYNDFSLRVRDELLIFVEAQSRWNINVVFRLFLYLALYWLWYYADGKHNKELFDQKKIRLAKPKAYILYSGDEKIPGRLSVRKLFYKNDPDMPDFVARVISGDPNRPDGTILDQFSFFERTFAEQQKLYDNAEDVVINTIRICLAAGALVEFFEENRGELENIMRLECEQDWAVQAEIECAVESAVKSAVKNAVKDAEARFKKETAKREKDAEARFKKETAKLKQEAARREQEAARREKEKSAINTAKHLLGFGVLSPAQIAQSTGLSLATVRKLAKAA
ncbi:MAG: hypothetical protein IJM30_08420 [Thermoguttaceae bacterium]|nr:hypothetical protein [Thermoguttaceae bacterium]